MGPWVAYRWTLVRVGDSHANAFFGWPGRLGVSEIFRSHESGASRSEQLEELVGLNLFSLRSGAGRDPHEDGKRHRM